MSNVNQPPWFNSEIFNLCRSKEWFRDRYKGAGNPEHNTKFSEWGREFKRLTEQKMQYFH